VFIPVSIGEKNYKNRPRNARVIVENKVALFPDTLYTRTVAWSTSMAHPPYHTLTDEILAMVLFKQQT